MLAIILWKEHILPMIDGQDIISLIIILIILIKVITMEGDFGIGLYSTSYIENVRDN